MALFWKKAKITRLAGFIADIRSRRRRSSLLLVQTGFPTSLADLIVKNRSRLRTTRSKQRSTTSSSASAGDGRAASSGDLTSSSSPTSLAPSPAIQDSTLCRTPPLQFDRSRSDHAENIHPPEIGQLARAEVTGRKCFSAAVKIFFVVVLGLVTKEIAIGITASALLLFLLESVENRSRLCSRLWAKLGPFFRRRRPSTTETEELRIGAIESEWGFDRPNCACSDAGSRGSFRISEIEAIDRSDISSARSENSDPISKSKLENLAVDCSEDLLKSKRSKSKRLMTSVSSNKDKFFTKLIPKKFRASKKLAPEIESKQEHEEENQEEEQEDDQEEDDCSFQSVEDEFETDKSERETQKRQGHHIHLLLVFVFVLMGLVGGKSLAILVIVSWLLLVKSAQVALVKFNDMYDRKRFGV